MLQISPIEVGLGGGLVIQIALLLKISFNAGQIVQKVDSHEKRLDHLEASILCQADDCPLRKEA